MFILIRKEHFGYVLFERYTRNLFFVETTQNLESLTDNLIWQFLSRYYPRTVGGDEHYEFISPPDHVLELSAPIGMYMEIARRCPLDCGHCYKPDDPGAQLMEIDAWKRLIKELHDIGTFEIRLCGNEPTASPYFRAICESISDHDMFLGINTNGVFSQTIRNELISQHPNFIAVSVDGDEVSHDAIRGMGTYRKAVDLLVCLKKTSIHRRINSVVTTQTINAIEHTVQLADMYETDVSFLPMRPIGRHAEFYTANAINKEQMQRTVEEIMRLRQRYPHLLLLTYFDVLGERATYHHSMEFNMPCPARKNGFVAYNGDFYPCDFLRYLGKVYHCGNVADSGFWSIWTSSPTLKRFQNLRHDKCYRCEHYLTKCYGGCISGSIASTGCPDDQLCFVDL